MSASPLQRAALVIEELRRRLAQAQAGQAAPEAIAVVGLDCRFPGGADSAEAYWELLCQGRDAVRDTPAERWPAAAAEGMRANRGGFLEEVARFDARFFGISPREAVTLDPQQRLTLEVAWEALEHAGYAPGGLSGQNGGVYLGICSNDYLRLAGANLEAINAYLATGNTDSVSRSANKRSFIDAPCRITAKGGPL